MNLLDPGTLGLVHSLLFMRPIAERLIFGEAAAAELRIFDGASYVAISIDEVHCPSNTDRSALGIYKYLDVVAHSYDLVEVIAKCLRTRWVA